MSIKRPDASSISLSSLSAFCANAGHLSTISLHLFALRDRTTLGPTTRAGIAGNAWNRANHWRFEWLHGLAGARRPSGKDPSRIPLPLFPQEADAEMECKHTAWGSRILPSRRSPLGGWPP